MFCTPEYAGTLPGSLKNLLDWTVGGGEIYGKPVGWINVAMGGRGTGAEEHLAMVLRYVGAVAVEQACLVVLKQGIDTTTPAGRFTFHVLAAMDEMLADLISEGTREGLESARARGRVGGRKPKLTARQAEVARGMYDETGADGRRKHTVAEIAEPFGVSRKTVYRHLEPSGGRRQPGKGARPAAPAEPLATLPHPIHARVSEPAARARTRPAAARAPLACPSCGREPATRHEAVQQREDLAIVWLHLDGDRVTEARHCVACQPHGPVIDVSCSCCGNGPLITGQPPELGDQVAASALDWMHSRGWQLHPQPLCPADHR